MKSLNGLMLTGAFLMLGTASFAETHINIYVPLAPPVAVREVRPAPPEITGYVWVPGLPPLGRTRVPVGGRGLAAAPPPPRALGGRPLAPQRARLLLRAGVLVLTRDQETCRVSWS